MQDGDFVWYELMTSDVAAARDFYAEVVGWAIEDSGMPGMTYLLARVDGTQIAGMMGFPPDVPGAKPGWSGYIAVADVDAMAGRVTAAGGTVHRAPGDIPGVGRFAVVADPQGAVFMLFRGEGDPAPELPYATPGTAGWHELHSSDREAALAFYQALFGWTKDVAFEMGPMGTYQIFATGSVPNGGMMNGGHVPGCYWLYYFNVADIDAAVARLTAGGGTLLSGPNPVPGDIWTITAHDPQGALFALAGPRA
jgi:predicted enzyme related to lactoylglutathione lyase